jgi:hypothetical protein
MHCIISMVHMCSPAGWVLHSCNINTFQNVGHQGTPLMTGHLTPVLHRSTYLFKDYYMIHKVTKSMYCQIGHKTAHSPSWQGVQGSHCWGWHSHGLMCAMWCCDPNHRTAAGYHLVSKSEACNRVIKKQGRMWPKCALLKVILLHVQPSGVKRIFVACVCDNIPQESWILNLVTHLKWVNQMKLEWDGNITASLIWICWAVIVTWQKFVCPNLLHSF